jgi:hypothetical protein
MALVDRIFGSTPTRLVSQFGISATYIKASQSETYDPMTGTVSGLATEIAIKMTVSKIVRTGPASGMDKTMVEVLIPASYLGNYIPQSRDAVRFSFDGVQVVARVIPRESYRGDSPILHSVNLEVS